MYLTLLIKLILVSKEQENEKGKGERESEGLLPFYLQWMIKISNKFRSGIKGVKAEDLSIPYRQIVFVPS